MKKIILACIVSLTMSFQSCVSTRPISLKGTYQKGSVKSKMDLSFEQAWEKAIDFIAETGVSIKLMDKSSGLIVSDATSFYGLTTIENKKGVLLNPEAYVVSEHFLNEMENSHLTNYEATGLWNMRIKETGKGSSTISINLHTIKAQRLAPSTRMHAESTGNFEKWVLKKITGL